MLMEAVGELELYVDGGCCHLEEYPEFPLGRQSASAEYMGGDKEHMFLAI